MSDPNDEYLEHKKKTAEDRDTQDLQAWRTWKNNPTRDNLNELRDRFKPEVDKRVHMFGGGARKIDAASLRLDLNKNLIRAFETYNPSRSGKTGQTASLRTHAGMHLRRSQRFVGTYQNIAKIPEEKIQLITPINQARDFMSESYGRDPTHDEIANYLNDNPEMVPVKLQGKVTPKIVGSVQKYQIKDIPDAGFESDPTSNVSGYQMQLVSSIRTALTPNQQTVYDYMYGLNGKPKIPSTSQIAKRLGKSDSHVSRIKTEIFDKFNKYSR